jgi:hypothetical protein
MRARGVHTAGRAHSAFMSFLTIHHGSRPPFLARATAVLAAPSVQHGCRVTSAGLAFAGFTPRAALVAPS